MSETDQNDPLLGLLAGVGVGVLVGAAAALLLAPQSGQETRTQIRGSADDLLEKLRDTVEELRSKVDEMVDGLRSRGGGSETDAAALAGSGSQAAPAAGE